MQRHILIAVLVMLLGAPPRLLAAGDDELVDRVRTAIDRGVSFLRKKEDNRGHWELDQASAGKSGGWTSLALLALLNCGVKPGDDVIQRGLAHLRKVEPRYTYVVGLQTMVFAEARQAMDMPLIQRNVDWLIAARRMRGREMTGWSYTQSAGNADNSNTQYALLGLHAGRQAGANIPRQVWEEIRDFYISTQQPGGGWSYAPGLPVGTTLTMTTAGFCGLYIAGMELAEGQQQLQADGSAANCGIYKENKPVADAYRSIGTQFGIAGQRGNLFYNLYGLERAGRLSGQRFFRDGIDWYRLGCEYLVNNQKDDHSWYVPNQNFDSWPVVSTSFALLFLSKGRTPVLISKLAYGQRDDESWNNKHNDARHLAEFASKEVFENQPVAWQIFDLRRAELSNDRAILDRTAELLQSPIAYMNGHGSNKELLTGGAASVLQKYLEEGGFLLAEACCGKEQFDREFKELLHDRVFRDQPDIRLRRLDENHPVWTSHFLVRPQDVELWGIEMGCKTVVIYSPRPLAGYWEANLTKDPRGELAFRIAANIIAYATGLELPKPRLTPPEKLFDPNDNRKVQRGFLKVAQLKHEGDWHPAPRAMSTLMRHLQETGRLDVQLKTEEMNPGHKDLANFKLMYMHGRNEFSLDDADLKNMRANLRTGGLLFADACCGKKGFDRSFRALCARLFPEHKLEPIPLDDELYSARTNNGEPITSVLCRREKPDGTGPEAKLREVAPDLEGIKVNDRWVVIYSKYDIGCALEKHQSANCLGHDHDSAIRLATAAVLYAYTR